jgi:hypothetical protein
MIDPSDGSARWQQQHARDLGDHFDCLRMEVARGTALDQHDDACQPQLRTKATTKQHGPIHGSARVRPELRTQRALGQGRRFLVVVCLFSPEVGSKSLE